MNERLNAWRECGAAFEKLGVAIAANTVPMMKALARTGLELEIGARRAYASAGKPYGDSDEGMWRWLEEVAVSVRRIERGQVGGRPDVIGE